MMIFISGGLLKGFHTPLTPTGTYAIAILDLHGTNDDQMPTNSSGAPERSVFNGRIPDSPLRNPDFLLKNWLIS